MEVQDTAPVVSTPRAISTEEPVTIPNTPTRFALRKSFKDEKWRACNAIFERRDRSVRVNYNTMVSKMRNGGWCVDEVRALASSVPSDELLILYESAILHVAYMRQMQPPSGGYFVQIAQTMPPTHYGQRW